MMAFTNMTNILKADSLIGSEENGREVQGSALSE
jgi:hypothetical protein